MYTNPLFMKDAYKISHHEQYPKGTSLIFSNFTPRKSRMPDVNHSVFFGLKFFIEEYLENFASKSLTSNKHERAHYYEKQIDNIIKYCGYPYHIEELIGLEYLPLAIYALPEGSIVPCGVPALVMFNTHPDFYWLPGMLETMMSATLWGMCTSATIARQYRLLLDSYAEKTSDMPGFVDYQAHDFSMRGMFGIEAGIMSALAHLQYFKGSDNVAACVYSGKKGPFSVAATEHSVMSAGGKENEFDTFKRLITETYPSGIVSIVSDTWNLWRVIDEFLPALKSDIIARDGTVVIRPDSGDPVDILTGMYDIGIEAKSLPGKGLIECLWEIFGGTINSKGFKQLDSHIGAIYGDSITIERARTICHRLEKKGFASTNIVFGVGSYTYQYNTRDTLGWAMKSTYAEIDGIGRAITKDPVTDDGTKKSHSGKLKVVKANGAHGSTLEVKQNCTWEDFHLPDNELKCVFKDGKILI